MVSGEERVRALLERVTYKPGWRIKVSRPTDRGLHNYWEPVTIQAQYPTVDVNTLETIMLNLHHQIDIHTAEEVSEDILVDLISHIIKGFEMHEFDEWFKLDGKHVRDPHPEENRQTYQLQGFQP